MALANAQGAAIWQALGIRDEGVDGLFLGYLSTLGSGEAIEAIGNRYNQALARSNSLAGLEQSARQEIGILSYKAYLDAVGRVAQLTRAYDKGQYVYDDSPALRRFLDEFSATKHTPDARGYARHILSIAPGMRDILMQPLPARLPAWVRERHSYIIGATGSGKSELLKILMAEHVRRGDAVLLLDPHSDLAEDLARLPVVAESGRLVFVRAVKDQTVTINPLQPPPGATAEEKELIAYHLAAVLNSLAGSTATSRMIRFLRSAIRVLLDRPGSTLLDLMALTDPTPPADIIARGCKHYAPSVRAFFTNDIGSRDMETARNGVRARLGAMLDASRFQAFTCGKTTLDLEAAIAAGKAVVLDLGSFGSVVGRDIGLLVVAMMTALAERRRVNRELTRPPVHVVIDECQLVVGEETADILDQMRKFGVHLTLAQQRAGQDMSQRVKEAALHAPAIKILGKSDSADAMLDAIGAERDMLRALTADRETGQFQFIVRWGNAKPFIMNVRNDLAGQRIGGEAWQALLNAQQATHYRPYSLDEHLSTKDNTTDDAKSGPTWELR